MHSSDYKGQVLFAHENYYADTTNSIAEAKALLQGLQLCKDRGMNHIDIEVDSLMLERDVSKQIAIP